MSFLYDKLAKGSQGQEQGYGQRSYNYRIQARQRGRKDTGVRDGEKTVGHKAG